MLHRRPRSPPYEGRVEENPPTIEWPIICLDDTTWDINVAQFRSRTPNIPSLLLGNLERLEQGCVVSPRSIESMHSFDNRIAFKVDNQVVSRGDVTSTVYGHRVRKAWPSCELSFQRTVLWDEKVVYRCWS